MKFDFVIGNPPYQETRENTSDKPVYNEFMDAAYNIADKVELITPARFLFNAGKTPKEWNKKMLNNKHLKVLFYEQISSKIFPNTDIKGGVAITYHDKNKTFEPVGVFSQFKELRSISQRLLKYTNKDSITNIIYLQNRFKLNELYADFPHLKKLISSDGNERRIVSSSFKLEVFHDTQGPKTDIQILGIVNTNKREYRWLNEKYVEDSENLYTYKVLIPKSNGSGEMGVIGTPVIASPRTGYTQSFLGIGSFKTKLEAENCLKYLKTKFARCALGILKITQDNPPEKWKFVPLQSFSNNSDIDWSKSIKEIDQQLYKKYGLDENEINFIETHVKEME